MLGFEALGRLALGELPSAALVIAPNLYDDPDTFFVSTIAAAGPDATLLPPLIIKTLYTAMVTRT